MENDIAPKLDKLKKEKADFLTFQKIEGELERLRRLLIAYDYMRSKVKNIKKTTFSSSGKIGPVGKRPGGETKCGRGNANAVWGNGTGVETDCCRYANHHGTERA
jgi:hypothetical protein